MNFWIKRTMKAIAILVILMMIYFTLDLWFNLNIPIISTIFGVDLVTNSETGRSIIMTSIFPNWIISLLCFVALYVSAGLFLKRTNKSK